MKEAVNLEDRKLIKSFRELNVYKKAFGISLDIHKVSFDFPRAEQFALTDQIRRASKSICANIAEGFGKQRASKAEFKRFLLIAAGSANEMMVWIDYCRELGYINQDLAANWNSEYDQVLKMLHALYNNA